MTSQKANTSFIRKMFFKLIVALLVALESIQAIPMQVYSNAIFIPNIATSTLNSLSPITSLSICECQCYSNSQCITGNYFTIRQQCDLYNANLSQGQLTIMIDTPAVVFTFLNMTTTTTTETGKEPLNPPVIIQWLFDGNLNDVYGLYNGFVEWKKDATDADKTELWSSPGYAGYSSTVKFSNSYGVVSRNLDLTTTSFTVTAWIWITDAYNASSDIDIYFLLFLHCAQAAADRCLSLSVKNGFVTMSFFFDDLSGNNPLQVNQWYHVAFQYDRSNSKQVIYLNGVFEGSRETVGSYSENTPPILFGSTPQDTLYTFRNGRVDKLTFVSRLMTESELLDEATLVSYYPFDGSYNDMGPNNIQNVYSQSTKFDSDGKINQALQMNGSSTACFRTEGFYYLGQTNYSFSFSLWIFPYAAAGLILQVNSPKAWCVPMINFDSGYLVIQSLSVEGTYIASTPFKSDLLNTWVHISMTYSVNNGIRLYINGELKSENLAYTDYAASNQINSITLGTCDLSTTYSNGEDNMAPSNQYQGKIDELKIFSRELTADEICQLVTGSSCKTTLTENGSFISS
ncbi:unnamed protein product [Adineta ricciae]|uniref:Uncharacterized protein n=1 Tax=Adineta ricciae TaxID=249248 RepID=A0A814KXM0_ADIRI|nr:unnamed protein product [Adineta ricciae]CAF1097278.1 unnamed protein product [Adineta ricciae]